MRTALSAMATWAAPASASEWTATVDTPIRRAVRMMRQAISPRLAMRSVRNMLPEVMLHPEQGFPAEQQNTHNSAQDEDRHQAADAAEAAQPGSRVEIDAVFGELAHESQLYPLRADGAIPSGSRSRS